MMNNERVVEINLGVTPEAAISGAVLIQTERAVFLTFNAMRPTDRPFPGGGYYREEVGTAVVELIDCSVTKFGYPNDEAWRNIPRTKGRAYGIFEIENSEWKAELVKLNKFSFPETKNWDGKHFLFLFHDSSFECIAKELKLEVTKAAYSEIFQKITHRVLAK